MCTRKEMGTNLEERNEDDELRSKENGTTAQRKPRKDTRKDSGKKNEEKGSGAQKKGDGENSENRKGTE